MADKVTKRVLDFTNVKDGSIFNTKRVPAGDYKLKVISVEEADSKAGNAQWVFALELQSKNHRGTYPYYCQLEEKALWKIRNLLIAAGKEVPKRRVNVDPNKLVGSIIGGALEDDEYEGKMKSTIVAVFPANEVDEDSSPAASGDDDETDDVDEDELEELDVEDL